MRRPALVPLDRMGFPLTLAGELPTAFADVVSTPLPGRLAALMRRLSADRSLLNHVKNPTTGIGGTAEKANRCGCEVTVRHGMR